MKTSRSAGFVLIALLAVVGTRPICAYDLNPGATFFTPSGTGQSSVQLYEALNPPPGGSTAVRQLVSINGPSVFVGERFGSSPVFPWPCQAFTVDQFSAFNDLALSSNGL